VVGVVDGPDRAADDAADGRAAEGLAHLQAAARELIQAARAVLDVAEELLEDPATVASVADAVGAVVSTAAQVGRRAVGHVVDGDTPGGGDGEAQPSGVERIRVG
jgi:hypothetical protein